MSGASRFLILLGGAGIMLLAGCASYPITRLYAGDPKPPNEVAYISDAEQAILEIDGDKVPYPAGDASDYSIPRFEILPGHHSVIVAYGYKRGKLVVIYSSAQKLEFDAEAGHDYRIKYQTKEGAKTDVAAEEYYNLQPGT